MIWIKISNFCNNFYIFSFNRNPSTDHNYFDSLLYSLASIQSLDRKAYFVFVSNVNEHHIHHTGLAGLHSCNILGNEQFVWSPAQNFDNCFDVIFIDVLSEEKVYAVSLFCITEDFGISCKKIKIFVSILDELT